MFVGIETTVKEKTKIFPGGLFLFCRVLVSSDTAYIAAWDALFSYVIKMIWNPSREAMAWRLSIIRRSLTLRRLILPWR